MNLRSFALPLLAATTLATIPPLAAAAFPEKPVKIVIPYNAGGGSDALARTIQAAVEKHQLMPQPLVVVNTTGAGGVVGARAVKNANPDGYTILQMHNELLTLHATGRLGFDPLEAYEPVAQTTQSCLYLATMSSSPLKTFDDVVAAAQKDPGKLKLADIIGGISHFMAVEMMREKNFKIGVVQTGGTSKRFASLKGGHTELAFMSPGWINRGGDQLRGLLWAGEEPLSVAKDMPTAKSLGLEVNGCLNRRYWAPAGTPPDRVAYMVDVLSKVLETPELKAYHAKQLSDIRLRTGAELKQDIRDEMTGFAKGADAVKQSMVK